MGGRACTGKVTSSIFFQVDALGEAVPIRYELRVKLHFIRRMVLVAALLARTQFFDRVTNFMLEAVKMNANGMPRGTFPVAADFQVH